MEKFILILIIISTIGSVIDFRKEMKKANKEEEIRRAFVRFLLSIILFGMAIIVFIF